MNLMTQNLLFIRALIAHADQLRAQMGQAWPAFEQRLVELVDYLEQAESDGQISLIVDEIYAAAARTPAQELVDALYDQASAEAGQVTAATRSVPMVDPTTGEQRDVPVRDEDQIVAAGGAASGQEVIAAAQEFAQLLEPKEAAVGESFPTDDTYSIRLAPEPAAQPEPAAPKAPTPGEALTMVKTHANLQGDDYAYLGQVYALNVKLSDQPQQAGHHVAAPGMEVPVEAGELVKKIQVRLYAPDFDLAPEDVPLGNQRELTFYVEAAASSTVTFKLLPQDRFEPRYFATLKVQFLVKGEIIGEAYRRVEALQSQEIEPTPLSAFPPAPGYALDEQGRTRIGPVRTPVAYQESNEPVHLTVTIDEPKNVSQPDKFLWDIVSPYLEPADYPQKSPGEDQLGYPAPHLGVEEFVRKYLAPFGMPGNWPEDHMDMAGQLKHLSVGMIRNNLRKLRHSAPDAFWRLYTLALDRHLAQGRTAEEFTILFRTADTHIPWELMPVADELSDGRFPLLLGTAHRVGRWLLEVGSPAPDNALRLEGFTLAVPSYENDALPEAEKEAETIKKYRPFVLPPDEPQAFIQFMATGRPTDGTGILHFAGHGDCCTDPNRLNWLLLTNKQEMYPCTVAADDEYNCLGKLRPTLAFFNACNVGRSAPGPLGSNGGWGRALLHQQYKGYVGPLWSVFDRHARDISQSFYRLALEEQLPLGEVMRRIRAKFSEDNRLFTYLAYLYLGHPLAKIEYEPFEEATNA